MATGYCSRHLAAEACPYANVCETCDNFVPAPESVPALRSQVTDIRALQADASRRGWTSEVERHRRVVESLEAHLAGLENEPDSGGVLDTPPDGRLIERVNKEIKRRTGVVGILPTRASVIRLAGAVLLEVHDQWAIAERRYLAEGSMALLDRTPDDDPTKEVDGGKNLLLPS